MRIKKYNRQPRIYTELYGPAEDEQDAVAGGNQDIPLGPEVSEESDEAVERRNEWRQDLSGQAEDHDADVELRTLEDQHVERSSQKKTEGSTTSGKETQKVNGTDTTAAPAFVPSTNSQENESAEKHTPATIACSGVASLTASAENVECDHVAIKIDDLRKDVVGSSNWGGRAPWQAGARDGLRLSA